MGNQDLVIEIELSRVAEKTLKHACANGDTLNLVKILYFQFADAADRRRYFAGAASGHSWSARRRRR